MAFNYDTWGASWTKGGVSRWENSWGVAGSAPPSASLALPAFRILSDAPGVVGKPHVRLNIGSPGVRRQL